jgi:type IV pilus assembly protein PilA
MPLAPLRARGIVAIELAAVVVVTLVMAALAISAYRTYSARSEVNRTLVVAAPVQALVAHAFTQTGIPPASNHDVPGLPDALMLDPLAQAIAVKHGRIQIRFGADAAVGLRGKILHVSPLEATDGHIVWQCGDGPSDVGLHPLGFAGGTNHAPEPLTTVEPRYLPDECR